MPKIPSLPPGTTLADNDEFPAEDTSASTTKRWTMTMLKAYLQALTGWISYLMIEAGTLRSDRINQSEWMNISRFYGYRTSNQSTTSSVNQLLATNSPNTGVAVTHTTKTGRVKIRCSAPVGNNANNMQIVCSHNGGVTNHLELNNFSINDSSMKYGEGVITGLTPNTSYTFGIYMRVDGGATATFYAFRTITVIVEDY